jgi:hypothetical protein
MARPAAPAARTAGLPPVPNEDHAIRIARDRNVGHDGAGFATRVEVETGFLPRYPVRRAGGETVLEPWVPAGELDGLDGRVVGRIRAATGSGAEPPPGAGRPRAPR